MTDDFHILPIGDPIPDPVDVEPSNLDYPDVCMPAYDYGNTYLDIHDIHIDHLTINLGHFKRWMGHLR